MKTAKITTETGYCWVTSVADCATQASLEFYFMNQRVNIGAYDDMADDEGEVFDWVNQVELIEGGEA